MKQYISDMIDALIKKDVQRASEHLRKYATAKSKALLEGHTDYLDIKHKCSNNSCVVKITFPSPDCMEYCSKTMKVVDLEKSVGGVASDKLIGDRTWIAKFTDVPNPEQFIQDYTDAFNDACDDYHSKQHDFSNDDYDDDFETDDYYDEDRVASDAEDSWLKGRGY